MAATSWHGDLIPPLFVSCYARGIGVNSRVVKSSGSYVKIYSVFSRRAGGLLVNVQEQDPNRPAAEDILGQLYMPGHLYEADGKLRLTDY